jgi:hypothetical protein
MFGNTFWLGLLILLYDVEFRAFRHGSPPAHIYRHLTDWLNNSVERKGLAVKGMVNGISPDLTLMNLF